MTKEPANNPQTLCKQAMGLIALCVGASPLSEDTLPALGLRCWGGGGGMGGEGEDGEGGDGEARDRVGLCGLLGLGIRDLLCPFPGL